MLNRLLKSLFVVLVFSSLCPATTQIRDRLIYDSNEYFGGYHEFPLEEYWSNEHPKPQWLLGTSTACYRGYVARWEVRNESLLLQSLIRRNLPNNEERPIPLKNIFPDVNGPVPADWFSGVLECTRGAKIKENVFISIHKGKVIGTRKATWEQLKNPSDKDLSWSSLLPESEKTGAIRTKWWWFPHIRWKDGESLFDHDDPTQSGKSFVFRGIYFPGGKLWAGPGSSHFLLEAPDSVKLPTTVTPVEVTAKSKNSHYFIHGPYSIQLPTTVTSAEVSSHSKNKYVIWHLLAVSHIKELPVGSAIQHSADNINRIIEYVIIAILIGFILVMFGIGILGFKKWWGKPHPTVES